ncbi:hypothetical protein ACFLZF_00540, partial [Nanoarchaeota archaeon]
MPKKPKKTREEKSSENYFPVNKSDLKKTTEKLEKQKPAKQEILKKSKEFLVKETSNETKT